MADTVLRKRRPNLRYLTREGARSIRSNRLMSVASIVVLTSCLLLIGLGALLFANINVALKGIQSQNVIIAYLDDGISREEAATVGQDIRMIPDVDHVTYVSKEEAYQQQLKSLGEDADVMDGLDSNPLPDSYEVTLKSLDRYSSVETQLRAVNYVQKIRGNSELASKVRRVRSNVSAVSIGVFVLLLLVSLFIIANTVRVTMFNRRREISIMKAVGATNWFIRWPFLVEGMIIGAGSSVAGVLLVWLVYGLSMRSLRTVFELLGSQPIPFSHAVGWLFLGFLVIGMLAGVLGSSLSMARYLKEQGSVVNADT